MPTLSAFLCTFVPFYFRRKARAHIARVMRDTATDTAREHITEFFAGFIC